MKIVVYGPDRRTGVLRDETVVDASFAYAKYLAERQGERHSQQLAQAMVPPDLAHFIEGGARTLDNTQKAIDYLFSEVQHQQGTRGEKIIHVSSEVILHAPVPAGARIACAGGNFADHAAAMASRHSGPDVKPFVGDASAEIRKTGIWGFWKITRETVDPDGELTYPARCNRLDYEGELAIVIGKKGKDIRAGRFGTISGALPCSAIGASAARRNPGRCALPCRRISTAAARSGLASRSARPTRWQPRSRPMSMASGARTSTPRAWCSRSASISSSCRAI